MDWGVKPVGEYGGHGVVVEGVVGAMFEGCGGEVALVVGLGESPDFVVDVGTSASGVGDVGAGFSFPFEWALSYLVAVAEKEWELDVV